MSVETIRDALEKYEKILADTPEKGRAKNPSATASLQDGLSFQVTGPRGETVRTDMAPALGGAASGAAPGWLLRAGLASCTATVIALRAASLGVTLDKLDVTVESEFGHAGNAWARRKHIRRPERPAHAGEDRRGGRQRRSTSRDRALGRRAFAGGVHPAGDWEDAA